MKVLCVLQNAWGNNSALPIIFKPNPGNKSARVISKILHSFDKFYFGNTTPVVTANASGRPEIDLVHVTKLLKRIESFDLILVCGKRAAAAIPANTIANKHVIYIKHPAARDLSNLEIAKYKKQIDGLCR
jgi:hypothetical protein